MILCLMHTYTFQVDALTLHATLTDFGLSRVMSGSTIVGTRTMMAGSPGFQAPEQLRAQSIGPHCDVYAFGCVLIVLFQERVLWPGLTPYQILCKVSVQNQLPDMSDLRGDVKSVCGRCLLPFESRPQAGSILQAILMIAKVLSAGFNWPHDVYYTLFCTVMNQDHSSYTLSIVRSCDR